VSCYLGIEEQDVVMQGVELVHLVRVCRKCVLLYVEISRIGEEG
jgi:hypothetical protein